MKPQHTPGPWNKYSDNRGIGALQIDGDNSSQLVSLVYGRDKDEQNANAKLIAAAPELFDALIAISSNDHLDLGDMIYDVRENEGEGWDGPSVKAWSDAVAKVRAAIQKATE